MNKKVYKTLEYNKILTMLSSYAACEETKKRCLSLEPITDLYEIRHLQTTTADALAPVQGQRSVLRWHTQCTCFPKEA